MPQVTYGQSGYVGASMSSRAAAAYADGEMPKSKWTKKAIVEAIKSYCDEFNLFYDSAKLKGMTKEELFNTFLEKTSWHHTGRFLNETVFYGLYESPVVDMFRPMTTEEVAARDAMREAERELERKRCEQEKRTKAFQRKREDGFRDRFGCRPDSVLAYEALRPDDTRRRIKKGKELIDYGGIAAGIEQLGFRSNAQSCPIDYAATSRILQWPGPFETESDFITPAPWHDIDFNVIAEMFKAASVRIEAFHGSIPYQTHLAAVDPERARIELAVEAARKTKLTETGLGHRHI